MTTDPSPTASQTTLQGKCFELRSAPWKKMRHIQKLTFECSQKMDHLMVFRQQCTCQLVSHGMKQHLKQLLENDLIEDLHPQVIEGTYTALNRETTMLSNVTNLPHHQRKTGPSSLYPSLQCSHRSLLQWQWKLLDKILRSQNPSSHKLQTSH